MGGGPASGALTTATLHAALPPLEAPDRVDVVARRLSEAIRLGLLADGQRLPSETDLAAHLGVSTVTLREALARLRHSGLLETRRGRGGGTVVCAPAGLASERLRERLLEFTVYELRELGDHRAAIAGMCAYLAAERALPFDVDRLQEELDRLANARTMAERWRADANFHVVLATAAQSSRLARAEVGLQTELGDVVWLLAEHEQRFDDIVGHHRKVIAAVRARRASAARDAITRHVNAEMVDLARYRMALDTD
ncbi:MAG TPA: FCD domain-containing protein [Mycobacteriales bacterium]|nr:FCD domain-containing protein [Mycobacteriales bacterium]